MASKIDGVYQFSVEALYNGHFGNNILALITEVAFVEGLFCTQTVHLGPGLYIVFLQGWPLIKRDSTVHVVVLLFLYSCIQYVTLHTPTLVYTLSQFV